MGAFKKERIETDRTLESHGKAKGSKLKVKFEGYFWSEVLFPRQRNPRLCKEIYEPEDRRESSGRRSQWRYDLESIR